AELAADDDRVAERRADIDDDARRRDEEGRPRRIGDGSDGDVVEVERRRIVRIEHDSGAALDHTRATAETVERLADAQRGSHRIVPAVPRGWPAVETHEHERRHELLELVVLGSTGADEVEHRMWVGEEAIGLLQSQEAEVLDLVERAALDHAASELA